MNTSTALAIVKPAPAAVRLQSMAAQLQAETVAEIDNILADARALQARLEDAKGWPMAHVGVRDILGRLANDIDCKVDAITGIRCRN